MNACNSEEPELSPTASLGTTYFVSSSGNDALDGTAPATVWRTTGRVNTQTFAPGDRVRFEGGKTFSGNLYFDKSDAGTSSSPVTLDSYGSGRATIYAGNGNGVFVYNAAGFVIDNLNLVGAGTQTNTGHGVLFFADQPGAVKYDYVRIDRAEVSGFLEGGVLIGADNAQDYTGYRDVRITRVVSHDNGDSGIQLFGRFVSNPGPNIPGTDSYANADVYIGDSVVYNNRGKPGKGNNSGNGIVLGSVDGAVVEYSLAYNNGELNDFADGGPVGIWAYDANNVTIQHNEAYGNKTGTSKDGGGFDLDGGVSNSVMQYNYAHDNEGAGFLLAQFRGARPFYNNTVRYNISENDGRKNSYAGIYLFAAPGFDIKDSAIYNNTVFVSPALSGTPSAFGVLDFGGFYDNVRVNNNIFVTTGGLPFIDNPDENGLRFNANSYYGSGGGFRVTWNGVSYKSLSALRRSTGQERLGGRNTGLWRDPRLCEAGQGGTVGNPRQLASLSVYTLRDDSRVIDKGLNLHTRFGIGIGTHDFYGNRIPRGTRFDLGAHEAR